MKILHMIHASLLFIWHIPRRIAQALVHAYQATLSPDHGPLRHIFPGGFCRYTPSCSSYSHKALGKYGLILGSLKSLWRILRCNPWSKGGIDLP